MRTPRLPLVRVHADVFGIDGYHLEVELTVRNERTHEAKVATVSLPLHDALTGELIDTVCRQLSREMRLATTDRPATVVFATDDSFNLKPP